jgi:DNA replication protein
MASAESGEMSGNSQPDQHITVPLWFLRDVAPRIRDLAELQVMLSCFRLQADPVEWSTPVSEFDLLDDEALRASLRRDGAVQPPDAQIRRGIELAVTRASLLQLDAGEPDAEPERWYLIASEPNRVRIEQYRSGKIQLPARSSSSDRSATVEPARPGIFRLYEQNIGLVTPIIADRLVEAMELYPRLWIEEAIEAAVSYNRRNWRYIQRILETWATEGRSNETNRRHQTSTPDLDPEKHISGEYAAVFRRRRRD